MAFATLAVHGAHWIAYKTEGSLNERARRAAARGWYLIVAFTILSLVATLSVRPQVLDNFRAHWWGWLIPLAVIASVVGMRRYQRRGHDLAAFLFSTLYIAAMLGGAAFAMYPYLLPATTDPARSLTIFNAQSGSYGLRVGFIWWFIGMALAVGYFIFLYRFFRGKVSLEEREGY